MRDWRWPNRSSLIAHPESLVPDPESQSSITESRIAGAQRFTTSDPGSARSGIEIRDEESGIRDKGFAISDEGWGMGLDSRLDAKQIRARP